jgi:hypothetical protein
VSILKILRDDGNDDRNDGKAYARRFAKLKDIMLSKQKEDQIILSRNGIHKR